MVQRSTVSAELDPGVYRTSAGTHCICFVSSKRCFNSMKVATLLVSHTLVLCCCHTAWLVSHSLGTEHVIFPIAVPLCADSHGDRKKSLKLFFVLDFYSVSFSHMTFFPLCCDPTASQRPLAELILRESLKVWAGKVMPFNSCHRPSVHSVYDFFRLVFSIYRLIFSGCNKMKRCSDNSHCELLQC